MELMRAYRTERGPGLTPLVPSIVAGRGRERWRGLCHVRPRGCAWRAYASDAPRPQARRRHRPRPWRAHARVALSGVVFQTPGPEHRRRQGAGAVVGALPRPPPWVCMAHVRFGRAEASRPAPSLAPPWSSLRIALRGSRASNAWCRASLPGGVGSCGDGSAPSASAGVHGACIRVGHAEVSRPASSHRPCHGAHVRVSHWAGAGPHTPGPGHRRREGVGERWRGLCPVRPRGCAWRTYASYAPSPQARRRHRPRPRSLCACRTERGPGLNPRVPSIVAGRGRGLWRGLCPVHPRGCAWRTLRFGRAGASRPASSHRPRPWSSCARTALSGGRASNPEPRALSPGGGGGGLEGSARPGCARRTYASYVPALQAWRRHRPRPGELMRVSH